VGLLRLLLLGDVNLSALAAVTSNGESNYDVKYPKKMDVLNELQF
jgi:hypothetical protein